jgi:hypothetical protein
MGSKSVDRIYAAKDTGQLTVVNRVINHQSPREFGGVFTERLLAT